MKSINQITHDIFSQTEWPCFFSKVTDSTNTWAKNEFHGVSPLALFLSDQQTQGRGRGNNSWSQAEPGSTLLSTWCLRLAQTPQPLIPIRVGLLLFESCLRTWPHLEWALKAPNDIYILDGKWAGILVEATQQNQNNCCYIGIGANIFSKPSLSAQKTTALADWVEFHEKDWQQFCYFFSQGLLQLQIDPARQNLLQNEIHSLEMGLKKYIGNQIQTLFPDGSLKLKNSDTVHWSEL